MPLRTSSVGTDDDGVPIIKVLADISERAWFGIEIVDGDVEEALDLTGVKIHRDHMVAAGRLQHVGDQFGRDGRARFVLLVLSRVGEVRYHGGDASSRGRLASVDHDQ